MPERRARDLIARGNKLFGKRVTLESLWQEQADNFYVERADFTRVRTLGEDMASHLLSSYPLLVRRDLQNAVSTMLRPTNIMWGSIHAMKEEVEVQNNNVKVYLEWARNTMWRAMYDRKSQFERSWKEADGDFISFGQAVLFPTLKRDRTGLLCKTYHLRDVAWAEDDEGLICEVHRKWKPSLYNLQRQFPGKLSPKLQAEYDRATNNDDGDVWREVECRHVLMYAEDYRGSDKRMRYKFVSVYIEVEGEEILEEISYPTLGYVIPRWVTVSGGWQYAFSPATVCALPDARLIQAMTRVLLEAGEKATYPPMLAVENAIRGDINVYASGITWVDAKYAGKVDEALVPLNQDEKGIGIGMQMRADIREMLLEAFFLNKLNLPQPVEGMTAFEVNQRVQEYIRAATPLFEPIDSEYNGAFCEEVFGICMRSGMFGRVQDIPEELRGQEVQFRFISPITQAEGADKVGKYQEAGNLLKMAMQMDPGAAAEVDARYAFRDALSGVGVPSRWLNDDKTAAKIRASIAQDEQVEGEANQVNKAAIVGQNVGKAVATLKGSIGPAAAPEGTQQAA